MILWAIFRNSLPLQVVALVLALWGVWEGNNALQRSWGRSEGRSEVTTIVKEKSDANTDIANAAGNDVAAGKRGKPDPNRLRHPAEGGTARPGK